MTFLGLLTILFIGLKLSSIILWSWWWVLAPLWGPAVVALFFVVFSAVGAGIATAWQGRSKSRFWQKITFFGRSFSEKLRLRF